METIRLLDNGDIPNEAKSIPSTHIQKTAEPNILKVYSSKITK
jgi:hypothetical protein